MVIIGKDVAIPSQCLLNIMLHIHQYSVHILCLPHPDLYIVDLLSQYNHMENKDQEITGMNIHVHATRTAVDIPIYTSIEDIKDSNQLDADLRML